MDIQPDKQNLDRTFASTVYYIDFYQRDYKCTDEHVLRLNDYIFSPGTPPDDVAYSFSNSKQRYL